MKYQEKKKKTKLETEMAKRSKEAAENRLEEIREIRENVEKSLKRANEKLKKKANEEKEVREELTELKKKTEQYLKLEDGKYSIKLQNIQEIELILREELKVARENIDNGSDRNNELKEENRKLNNKWLDAETKVEELRESIDDWKTQVSHHKGKAQEYIL